MSRQRNHAVRVAAAQRLVVSIWKSVVVVVLHSTQCFLFKWGQLKITCLAVSYCHLQLQAGESKPGTRCLYKNAARPILPVQICVRRLLCAFGKPACRRSISLRCGILSGFQPPPGLESWRAGGGPPSSSFHQSQHHCSAICYARQRSRGAGRGSVGVVVGGWSGVVRPRWESQVPGAVSYLSFLP